MSNKKNILFNIARKCKNITSNPKDLQQAIIWYSLSAHEGSKKAANSLFAIAIQYKSGDKIRKNSQEAVRIFKLAANEGHLKSQLALGYIYSHGKKAHKSLIRSAKYYSLAIKSELVEFYHKIKEDLHTHP
jgi:TPR repeat protein